MERWFYDMPLITRIYTASCVAVALAIQFKYITQYQLYFHLSLVINQFQIWRLITTFVYFGSFGLDFIFYMFFMTRHCRSLEEGTFRNKRADFLFMILFGMGFLLILGILFGIPFLGSSLVFMMVYVWSRKNPFVMMDFLGVFTFTAPYLPWVFLGFQMLLFNTFPASDLLGMIVGHLYYYLSDIYPLTHNNRRILETPQFLQILTGEYQVPVWVSQ